MGCGVEKAKNASYFLKKYLFAEQTAGRVPGEGGWGTLKPGGSCLGYFDLNGESLQGKKETDRCFFFFE